MYRNGLSRLRGEGGPKFLKLVSLLFRGFSQVEDFLPVVPCFLNMLLRDFLKATNLVLCLLRNVAACLCHLLCSCREVICGSLKTL